MGEHAAMRRLEEWLKDAAPQLCGLLVQSRGFYAFRLKMPGLVRVQKQKNILSP